MDGMRLSRDAGSPIAEISAGKRVIGTTTGIDMPGTRAAGATVATTTTTTTTIKTAITIMVTITANVITATTIADGTTTETATATIASNPPPLGH
jgi:hypothetical protein